MVKIRVFAYKVFLWAGLVCLGFFFFCGLVGIFRGYSVQSRLPAWIEMTGIFLLLAAFCLSMAIYSPPKQWVSILISISIIISSGVSLPQGRYYNQGNSLYKDREFQPAIRYFEKELNTWYLRLKYNYHEEQSLFRMGQAYSQLGQFDRARESYERLGEIARGYYEGRAQEELAALDTELERIAVLEEKLAGAENDCERAKIMFDSGLAYFRIHSYQKAIDQYERILSLDTCQSWEELAAKSAAELQEAELL